MDDGRGKDVQGELEGLMGSEDRTGPTPGGSREPDEPDEPPRKGPEAEETAPASSAAEPGEEPGPDGPPEEAAALATMVEKLEERVSLLLERHAEVLEAHREALEERRAMGEKLDRLREEGADPEELLETIRGLEAENGRLTDHAAFLEGRIESLLTRVRYVVES